LNVRVYSGTILAHFSSHSASEESEVEDEEQESDKDTLTKQADKKKESTNTAKRKTEELTEEIRPKKIKVDRASTEEEERVGRVQK
jgi:hypothetical protein